MIRLPAGHMLDACMALTVPVLVRRDKQDCWWLRPHNLEGVRNLWRFPFRRCCVPQLCKGTAPFTGERPVERKTLPNMNLQQPMMHFQSIDKQRKRRMSWITKTATVGDFGLHETWARSLTCSDLAHVFLPTVRPYLGILGPIRLWSVRPPRTARSTRRLPCQRSPRSSS